MKQDQKVEFVKQNYPDIKRINPYLDHQFKDDLKKKLLDVGLYTPASKHLYNETALINIILRAQGKKVFNRRTCPKTEN